MDYTLKDNKLYAANPDELKGKRLLMLKNKVGTFSQKEFRSTEAARQALIWSGRGKPGDRLFALEDSATMISELDYELYWRNVRGRDPVAVIQPKFTVEWEPDDDPDVSWLEEWIESSVEDGWLNCEECGKKFKEGDSHPTTKNARAEMETDETEIVAEEGGNCPHCGYYPLEPVYVLRIGRRGEPQPGDNPESYVADREYYATRDKAIREGWDSWGNHIYHEGCIVKATWCGLTGEASCWGFSFGPTSDYQQDQEYRHSEEENLKSEALDDLMRRLEARAALSLP